MLMETSADEDTSIKLQDRVTAYGRKLEALKKADCRAAEAQADEVIALAEQKGAVFWKALGMSAGSSYIGTPCLAAHRRGVSAGV
jgi:hypothetical protein